MHRLAGRSGSTATSSHSSSAGSAARQSLHLSPPSICEFFKCRKRFEYEHVLQEEPSVEDAAGDPRPLALRALRLVLEKLHELPGDERTLEAAEDLVYEVLKSEPGLLPLRIHKDLFISLVYDGLDNYFKLEDPAQVKSFSISKLRTIPGNNKFGNAMAAMFVEDELDRLDAELDKEGRSVLTIVRYSLAGAKGSEHEEPNSVLQTDEHQLRMQAWLLSSSKEYAYDELRCRLICLGGVGDEKAFTISKNDLEISEREVEQVCSELRQDAKLDGKVSTRCSSCAFRSRCDTFRVAPAVDQRRAEPVRPPASPVADTVERLLEEVSSRNAEKARSASTAAEVEQAEEIEEWGEAAENARASTEGVTVVSTPNEAKKVLRKLMTLTEDRRYHAVDTETKGWSPDTSTYGNGEITCFSIYCGDDVDFGGGPRIWVDNMDRDGNLTGVLDCFKEYLEDPSIKKVFHNFSFDRAMFHNAGIVIKGFAGDTMHMARLEHSDRDAYSLTALGAELVGIDWSKQSLSDLMKAEKVRRVEELHLSTSEATREAWVEYSTFDTVATWKLHERLSQLLSERPWQPPDEKKPIGTMLDFYQKCWCPFGGVLATMEGRGVPLDLDVINEQRGLAEQDLVAHTKAFKDWVKSEYSRRYAGAEELDKLLEDAYNINLTSPVQLRHLLFGQGVQIMASNNMMVGGLGLPTELVETRTPKGEISLGAAELEALVGPDPDNGKFGTAREHLGEEGCKGLAHKCAFSKVSKALSSFLSKLPERVARTSGRVHSSFNLHTGTGRLSSSNPNLQQLPALDKDAYKVRSAIAPRKSRRLIVADYGQLDIRVLAHITKCKSMIEALRSGVDFHSNTALNMYAHVREAVEQGTVALEKPAKGEPSVPLVKDVFATERRHAKAVNFGIAYGLTAHGLASQLDCSQGEAERMIDKWYAACPEVKEWQGRIVKEAQKHDTPYVVSLRGRPRMIPDLKYYECDSNQTRSTGSSGYGRSRRTPTWKDNAQRPSWQDRQRGSGAQRQAINAPVQGGSADVVVEAMLKADGSEELRKLGYEMILQVHDELVFEGPEENAEEALSVVREIMENPFIDGFKMEVPLPVDAQITKTWADAKG